MFVSKKKGDMKLTQTGMTKDPSGLIEVTVTVHNKYVYLLESEYAYNKFRTELLHNKSGSALNILKKFSIKEGA